MRNRHYITLLAAGIVGGCQTTGTLPYLRVEDYYQGWNFVGARFTPDVDAELRVLNAPVPCGASFCSSGTWQPIGTIRTGPVGGTWPNVQGQFGKVIKRDEMTARRGMAVTCYPGEWWSITFAAKDPVTQRSTIHHGATTAGFFYDLPRCPAR